MSNLFLNIIIGLSAIIIGVLAFADEIGKTNFLRFLKSLPFKIIVFIIASFFGIWATVKKDSNAEIQSKNDKLESKNEQSKRDSINRLITDESNSKIVTTFTNALAQYGLKYDSTKKEIITFIKDSSKNKIDDKTVIGVCPTNIGILSEKRENDNLHIEIRFCNFGQYPAYNVNITAEFLVKKGNSLEHNEFGKSPLNLTISTETRYVMRGHTVTSTINWSKDTLYLFIKATYSNYTKTTKQVVRELYQYEYSDNSWGVTPGGIDIPIIKALKESNFY